jgi:chemotaxis protein CheX
MKTPIENIVKTKLKEIATCGTNSHQSIKAEIINPFIESAENLFQTMFSSPIKKENPNLQTRLEPTLDIISLIGLSGAFQGIVSMSFPIKTSLNMVSYLYGKDIVVVDSTVIDAVAEFVNVLAGGAQSKLNKILNEPIELSIPTVIRGNQFSIEYPMMAKWIEIPFTSNLGQFVIRVTVKNPNMVGGILS